MGNSFKIKAGVSIECKNCGSRTTVPALKVDAAIKCQHCGADLTIDKMAYAAKAALLIVAGNRNDVDMG